MPKNALRNPINPYPPKVVCRCERPTLMKDRDGDPRCVTCGHLPREKQHA